MKALILLRLSILVFFILISTFTFAQTNAEKIKAKWLVDKFEVENNSPQAIQAKEELAGVALSFENDQLIITRRTEDGENVLKKGQYFISDDSIMLGKDSANILLLSEKLLTIQIPKQGILYLIKL